MWPWQTSSTGYQPPANFPGIHSSVPHPSTHFVGSQASIPIPGYPTLAHGDFSHSHAGIGIRYGLPGMSSRSPAMMTTPMEPVIGQTVQPMPDSATPPVGVVYHRHPEDMSGVVHGIHPPTISSMHGTPNPPLPPSLQENSLNQWQSNSTSHGGVAYHQSSPPIVTSPPQSNPGFTSPHHVHGSSPFSMDFILRERPIESSGGVSAVVPNYMGVTQPDKGNVIRNMSVSYLKVPVCVYHFH